MKALRLFLILTLCVMLLIISSCSLDVSTSSTNGVFSTSPTDTASSTAVAITDSEISATETDEEFSFTTSDGVYEKEDNVYTIKAAGTYTLSGYLNGQIVVDASEDDEVVIELENVTIEYSSDSPVKLLSAMSVDISAKSNTENVIKDTRSTKTTSNDEQGEGAIYAKCDLKIKGTGTLLVSGTYNNGIHTTKDLKIQKVSLKVTAYNNALKGNDSITIVSGNVVAISTNGDGIKTENTDLNKNNEVRGDILISGGSLAVYAAGDGIQAAHNFEMTTENDDNVAPSLVIYTGSYSGYTASNATTTSYKGVKVQNELNIKSGSVDIKSYDDGLHADYGTKFTSGDKGIGTINISGGSIVISVYSPTTKTAGGRSGPGGPPGGGPGGWGGQQSVSGADGIHADYTLNISGGTIEIDSAFEGLEANVVNVTGGTSYVIANDDGINACSGFTTPVVKVSGGYLDITVSPQGDTDGIDSNGSYQQTGGVVITRGPNSQMACAIDSETGVIVTGGTLIILGYGSVSKGSNISTYSLSLHYSGSHSVTIDGVKYTFNNSYTYGRTLIYSDVDVDS